MIHILETTEPSTKNYLYRAYSTRTRRYSPLFPKLADGVKYLMDVVNAEKTLEVLEDLKENHTADLEDLAMIDKLKAFIEKCPTGDLQSLQPFTSETEIVSSIL